MCDDLFVCLSLADLHTSKLRHSDMTNFAHSDVTNFAHAFSNYTRTSGPRMPCSAAECGRGVGFRALGKRGNAVGIQGGPDILYVPWTPVNVLIPAEMVTSSNPIMSSNILQSTTTQKRYP